MTFFLLNKGAALWPFISLNKKGATLKLSTSSLFKKEDNFWPAYSPKTIAIIFLVLGQFAIALGVFCIKLSVDEIGSLSTTFNRFWMAAMVLWLWNIASQPKPKSEQTHVISKPESTSQSAEIAPTPMTYSTYLRFALCGLIFAACLVLWAWSLQYTTVANSTLMHDLSPLFATILGWLLFNHHFSKRFLMAVGLTLVGVVAIGFEDFQVGISHLVGDSIALASAILLALYCLLVGQLRQQFTAGLVLLWTCLIGAVGLLPLILFTSAPLLPTTLLSWFAVAGVVCLSQIIGQGLTAFSLKQLSSEFVSLFLPLEAVFAALIAWLGWNEPLTPLNCFGFILVLMGIYMALLSPGTTEAEEVTA
ncbi:MAG: DMT family transporter [Cyanothece sp. SIO2G6]|nr:DMT family transporter [Cyanothece sp. SIO2G6]